MLMRESVHMALMNSLHRLDNFLFTAVFDGTNGRAVRGIARGLSHSGDGYLHLMLPAFLLFTAFPHALLFAQLLLLALVCERVLYWGLKNSLKRPRPADARPDIESLIVASDQFSFPSGHTSAAFLLVTTLVVVYGPVFQVLYLWSALVAVSRVVLGVHYPGDTVAGAAMGILTTVFAAILLGV
jgi:undecaprenyl-diphosphatase